MTDTSPIDTRPRGNPAECHDVARWFTTTAGNVTDAGSALGQAGRQSQRCWGGDSGTAFRAKMGQARGEVDELAAAFERSGKALEEFATALDEVHTRLDRARTQAVAAGLQVTDGQVVPPVATVPAAALESGDPAQVQAAREVTARYGAFNEAAHAVADARALERAAHDRLVTATNTPKGVADVVNARNLAFAAIGVAKAASKPLAHETTRWAKASADHGRFSTLAKEYLASDRVNPNGRASTHTMRAIAARSDIEAAASRSNSSMLGRVGETPGVGVLKRVPGVGWGLTAVGVGLDVKAGKPADQAIASGVASQVAGTAAALATPALLALAPAAIAGGPVTLAAVGVGIAVSMGVGYLVDNHYDEIKDVVGDAAETVQGWFGGDEQRAPAAAPGVAGAT